MSAPIPVVKVDLKQDEKASKDDVKEGDISIEPEVLEKLGLPHNFFEMINPEIDKYVYLRDEEINEYGSKIINSILSLKPNNEERRKLLLDFIEKGAKLNYDDIDKKMVENIKKIVLSLNKLLDHTTSFFCDNILKMQCSLKCYLEAEIKTNKGFFAIYCHQVSLLTTVSHAKNTVDKFFSHELMKGLDELKRKANEVLLFVEKEAAELQKLIQSTTPIIIKRCTQYKMENTIKVEDVQKITPNHGEIAKINKEYLCYLLGEFSDEKIRKLLANLEQCFEYDLKKYPLISQTVNKIYQRYVKEETADLQLKQEIKDTLEEFYFLTSCEGRLIYFFDVCGEVIRLMSREYKKMLVKPEVSVMMDVLSIAIQQGMLYEEVLAQDKKRAKELEAQKRALADEQRKQLLFQAQNRKKLEHKQREKDREQKENVEKFLLRVDALTAGELDLLFKITGKINQHKTLNEVDVAALCKKLEFNIGRIKSGYKINIFGRIVSYHFPHGDDKSGKLDGNCVDELKKLLEINGITGVLIQDHVDKAKLKNSQVAKK